MKRHLVLVRLYTNFELNNSKFAQVTEFRENFKTFKISKNLNGPIDFGQIQYRCTDVLYLCTILGR